MKRLLVFLLVFILTFSLVACGGDDEVSEDESKEISSVGKDNDEKSKDEASESKDISNDAKDDESDDTSEDESNLPKFTNKFVSFSDAVSPSLKATDTTSVRFTKVNEAAEEGDVVLFTKDFGATISTGSETYEDYAVLVCTYDHKVFKYTKTSLKLVGKDDEKAKTKIPADGFVIAVHKEQKTEIAHLNNIKDDSVFFVHGVQIGDVSATMKKAAKKPTIDGKITETEYGKVIWDVDENNTAWDYSQFEEGNYYAKAKVYATYDDKNLYVGVIVDSPEHYNPLKEKDDPKSMYKYECIQVNVSTEDPLGDYMSENFDYAINKKAIDEGVLKQYGFGVNEDGETLLCIWMGAKADFTGEAKCIRDDDNQMTYYEASIPWEEFGTKDKPFEFKDIEKIGFSVSINSTTKADADAGTWKNIRMRDGGGIIARNDFTKIASITLK